MSLLSSIWKASLGDSGIPFTLLPTSAGNARSVKSIVEKLLYVTMAARIIIGAGGGKVLDTARAIASDARAPISEGPSPGQEGTGPGSRGRARAIWPTRSSRRLGLAER